MAKVISIAPQKESEVTQMLRLRDEIRAKKAIDNYKKKMASSIKSKIKKVS